MGGSRVEDIYTELRSAGIASTSNYSCAEIGPLAHECPTCPGYYHAAHSNVILEEDKSLTASIEGKTLSRILVTYLHGYATPAFRYDIGDFALFHAACPCGHVGPVLSDIYGRRKNFLRHRDGRFTEFMLTANTGRSIMAFKEWRFQQISYDQIKVEISGVPHLDEKQRQSLEWLVQRVAGPDFSLAITLVDEIDWSDNPKKLQFVCQLDASQ